MVDRLRSLSMIGKMSFTLLILAALIGCYFGGKRLLHQDRSSVVAAERAHADWYTVEITEQGWNPAPWFASTSAFTGVARIQTRFGFMFIAHGSLRITDQSGNLIRSWAAIKRVRCDRHQNDNDRLTDHSGTVTFDWTWNGTNGNGVPQTDGQYNYTFTVKFRAKQDSEQGTIGIDRTAPSITIEQPQGQIAATDVPVAITWSDSAAGIDASTGSASIDDTPVTGLTIDASGARGTASSIAVGQHTIAAIVRDTAGNEASASGIFELIEEQGAPEQRTSIVGTVADSTGTPLADVSVTSPGATRSVTTDTDGKFLIEMTSGGTHWLTFATSGYIAVQRPAEVTEGQHSNIGEARLVAVDSNVTTIGPAGGTAANSTGDVELVIPASALGESHDFRLTPIPTSKELPGPLNSSDNVQYPIAYTNSVVIEPADISLSQPVTLRVRNRWGFPAGFRIPTAFWNDSANRWVPTGGAMVVSADGAMIEEQLAALDVASAGMRSARARSAAATAADPPRIGHDMNLGSGGTGSGPGHDAGSSNGGCNPAGAGGGGGAGAGPDSGVSAGASDVSIFGSRFHKTIALPAVKSPDGDMGLSFEYNSNTALPSHFLWVVDTFGSGASSMLNWASTIEINGQRKEAVFSPGSGPSRQIFFWDGKNGAGAASPTGLYELSAATAIRYTGYYVAQSTWGGMPTGLTSVPSSESVEKTRVVKKPVALINNQSSPYGAGWSLSGLPRIHAQSDGKVLIVNGGAPGTVYYPYLNFARIAAGAGIAAISNESNSLGDKRNMLGYHGTGAAVSGQLRSIDYQDGFSFAQDSTPGYDWVVVDLGQDRQLHTLGLSFQPFDPSQAVVTDPIIEIYTSLDHATWSLWSQAHDMTFDGANATKLSSPYLASHATTETVRYVKYQVRRPASLGAAERLMLFRLLAFGPSEEYGDGEYGQDHGYPRLRRLQDGTFEQTERNGATRAFDLSGNLARTTNVHGLSRTYTWEDGLLTRITDSAGGVTTLAYSGGKLLSVTDPAGRQTLFTIDGNGDLSSVRMPDGSDLAMAYDSRHLLTSQTDARGGVTALTWSTVYPRLEKVRKPDGSERTFGAGYFDHLINGLTGTDSAPSPAPQMDLEGTITDELGRTTRYKWEQFESAAPYYPNYRVTITDPVVRETVRYMHPRMDSQEALRFDPDGSQMRNTYDGDEGRYVLKVEDLTEPAERRAKAQYTYEPTFMRVSTSTDSGGHTTSYSYNSEGDLVTTTDPTGYVTTMVYDSGGELSSVTDAEGAVTRYEYDSRGNRTKTIDAIGRETTMSYDAAGNMLSLTDPAGKLTRWECDQMGRVTKVIDPAGGQTSYVYEAGPCTSGCGGGASNLLKSITDPAGRTTRFEYDTAGRMTAVVNPLGIRKEYSYDLGGRLTRFRNGRGQEIVYEYDAADRLLRKTLPDEGAVEYSYDVNNQVTRVADSDSVIRYEYGSGSHYGNMVKGQRVREYFGEMGNPAYDRQMSGSFEYQYNVLVGGREVIELLGTVELDVDMPDGTMKELRWISRGYDAAHRLTNYTNRVPIEYRYDRVGRLLERKLLTHGISADYQYDPAGQLLQVTHQGQTTGAGTWETGFSYQYDAGGNRTAMVDQQGSHAFGYDDRYQLTSATHPTIPAESFGYDGVGNRTSSHISPSYSYDAANQLLEDGEFVYAYDADGNCIRKVSKLDAMRHEYVFNSENRMTGYRKYDAAAALLTTADYFYDALGRRIAKEVNGQRERYLYQDEDVCMVEEWPSGGNYKIIAHAPGIDNPIYFYYENLANWGWGPPFGGYYSGVWTYYPVTDALGSVRELRNYWAGNGTVTTSLTYDSFGQISPPTDAENHLYAFTGRQWDSESGLYFLRARYMDPRSGRFTAEDPLLAIDWPNLYPYVENRPVDFDDPFGLITPEEVRTIMTIWIGTGATIGTVAGATAGGAAGGMVGAAAGGAGAPPGAVIGSAEGAAVGGTTGALAGAATGLAMCILKDQIDKLYECIKNCEDTWSPPRTIRDLLKLAACISKCYEDNPVPVH